jgi:hypothetical protein
MVQNGLRRPCRLALTRKASPALVPFQQEIHFAATKLTCQRFTQPITSVSYCYSRRWMFLSMRGTIQSAQPQVSNFFHDSQYSSSVAIFITLAV